MLRNLPVRGKQTPNESGIEQAFPNHGAGVFISGPVESDLPEESGVFWGEGADPVKDFLDGRGQFLSAGHGLSTLSRFSSTLGRNWGGLGFGTGFGVDDPILRQFNRIAAVACSLCRCEPAIVRLPQPV